MERGSQAPFVQTGKQQQKLTWAGNMELRSEE